MGMHVKKYTRKILALFLFLFLNVSYAENVLPTFTGNWYTGIIPDKVNSCEDIFFKYINQQQNDAQIAQQELSQLTPHMDCTWGNPYKTTSAQTPPDFPTSDYPAIVQAGHPQSETWEVDCKSPNGYVYDTKTIDIYPSYTCPTGSRRDFDSSTNKMNCSTTPHVCEADVVGRDLDSAGLGMIGHVGLTTPYSLDSPDPSTSNLVVEVLNNDAVINQNTLQSFEHPGTGMYWGEVYGLPDSPDFVDGQKAYAAVGAGLMQRQYNPEYTITTNWQEGRPAVVSVYDKTTQQFSNQNTMIRAMFRCDTFVNYCINKGFGVTIPTGLAILPHSTYNSFLNQRNDVPIQTLINSALHATNSSKFNEIDFVSHDNSLHRDSKLNSLFSLATQNSNDTEKFSYIMDTLSGLRAKELIPDLINLYNKETIIQNKLKLLSAIARSSIVYAGENSEYKNNILMTQELFVSILKNETNPEILENTLHFLSNILPVNKENYVLINQVVAKLQTSTHQSYDNEKIALTFSNPQIQASYLSDLLNAPRSNQDKEHFDRALLSFIKSGEIENISSSKNILVNYLNRSALTQTASSSIANMVFNADKKIVMNKLFSNQNQMLLTDKQDVLSQAIFILRSSDEDLKAIPPQNKQKLISDLSTGFVQVELSKRKWVVLAIERLR